MFCGFVLLSCSVFLGRAAGEALSVSPRRPPIVCLSVLCRVGPQQGWEAASGVLELQERAQHGQSGGHKRAKLPPPQIEGGAWL